MTKSSITNDQGVGVIRLIITSYGQAAFGLIAVLVMGAGGLFAFQSVVAPQLDANRSERDKLQSLAASIERSSENLENASNANRQTAQILEQVTNKLLEIVREPARRSNP